MKPIKRAIFFSGGYESTYCHIRYPNADCIYIEFEGSRSELTAEMKRRHVRIVRSPFKKQYATLQSLLFCQQLGYDELIVGMEDDRTFRYIDDVLWAENNPECWRKFEESLGVRITNACENLTHKDVIRKVLEIVKKEDVLTCDNWTPKAPRCYKCEKCKQEMEVLEDLEKQ